MLLEGGWLPSVTITDGEINLYVNGTRPGDYYLARYALGFSGVDVGLPEPIDAPHDYFNVHVVFRSELNEGRGFYHIFGERFRDENSDETVIDYLTSDD